MRKMEISSQFLKTTSDRKVFSKFYELEIYQRALGAFLGRG